MTPTAMAREIAEAPQVVRRLLAQPGAVDALASRLKALSPRLVVVNGRGSSGHVGILLRYLIETRLGIPVSATAPSITTNFRCPIALDTALFIVISQSGRSPDIIETTRAARAAGAMTIAILNETASPLAEMADVVLPVGAGVEHSVAATKTVIASMALAVQLVASWAEDTALQAALATLPERLEAAQTLDWRAWRDSLPQARAAYVTGRGFGFGPAREIALKMAETLRLPALAYSAAELLHGPRAAISPQTPVLALRVADETALAVDALCDNLTKAGERVHLAGGPASTLPWIGDGHPVIDAITFLAPAYTAIEARARAMGFDPDHPPHLEKVTQTL